MKKSIIFFICAAVILSVSSFAGYAYAVETRDGGGMLGIQNPIIADDITSFVVAILNVVIKIGFVIAVFFLMYAGFLFVTAQGNDEKLSTAKKAFLWTVIGIVLLLGAKVVANVVCGTINELATGTLKCQKLR